ncbi:unnamed protein product [Sphenostylis stenocarpa]|uniref:Uncharacterized protein n=1 Tax=Sphenostylis stenocarpa TaxID=92480 RepID=A0AA86T6U9_9FABA|nr:unnamed protein product [Sphenostylis stenocarpa]
MASPSSCGPHQNLVSLVCFVTLGKDKVMNVEDPEIVKKNKNWIRFEKGGVQEFDPFN